MAEFQKVTLTNTAKGPRGANTREGLVMLEPGESRRVELSEAELKSAKGTGYFEFGTAKADKGDPGKTDAGKSDAGKTDEPGKAPEAKDDLETMSFGDLKARAAERGLNVPVGTSKPKLRELLRAPANG